MIWLIIGLVLVGLAGMGFTFVGGYRLAVNRRRTYVIKAICEGCGHHSTFHEKDGGACHYLSHDYYDGDHQCTCLRYDGPTPLPPDYLPERSNP